MNEKTIDQIEEEVLIYEISDEAVEAAGTRTEIAGVWTFVCTGALNAIRCLHSSNEKPRPGETGALRTEGGGVGGAFHPTKIFEPLHVDGGSAVGASSFSRQGSPRSFSCATA